MKNEVFRLHNFWLRWSTLLFQWMVEDQLSHFQSLDPAGKRPLFLAIQLNHLDLVKFLVDVLEGTLVITGRFA